MQNNFECQSIPFFHYVWPMIPDTQNSNGPGTKRILCNVACMTFYNAPVHLLRGMIFLYITNGWLPSWACQNNRAGFPGLKFQQSLPRLHF